MTADTSETQKEHRQWVREEVAAIDAVFGNPYDFSPEEPEVTAPPVTSPVQSTESDPFKQFRWIVGLEVKKAMSNYGGQRRELTYHDLFNAGYVGLVKARKKFDPNRAKPKGYLPPKYTGRIAAEYTKEEQDFLRYAWTAVRNAIVDEERKLLRTVDGEEVLKSWLEIAEGSGQEDKEGSEVDNGRNNDYLSYKQDWQAFSDWQHEQTRDTYLPDTELPPDVARVVAKAHGTLGQRPACCLSPERGKWQDRTVHLPHAVASSPVPVELVRGRRIIDHQQKRLEDLTVLKARYVAECPPSCTPHRGPCGKKCEPHCKRTHKPNEAAYTAELIARGLITPGATMAETRRRAIERVAIAGRSLTEAPPQTPLAHNATLTDRHCRMCGGALRAEHRCTSRRA